MAGICYKAIVKSPRGAEIDEKIFRKKNDANAFKLETEYDSEKKVRIKKIEC